MLNAISAILAIQDQGSRATLLALVRSASLTIKLLSVPRTIDSAQVLCAQRWFRDAGVSGFICVSQPPLAFPRFGAHADLWQLSIGDRNKKLGPMMKAPEVRQGIEQIQ
jgi:hypothetical protein